MIDPNYVIKTHKKSFINSNELHLQGLFEEFERIVPTEAVITLSGINNLVRLFLPMRARQIESALLKNLLITHPIF